MKLMMNWNENIGKGEPKSPKALHRLEHILIDQGAARKHTISIESSDQ